MSITTIRPFITVAGGESGTSKAVRALNFVPTSAIAGCLADPEAVNTLEPQPANNLKTTLFADDERTGCGTSVVLELVIEPGPESAGGRAYSAKFRRC